MAVHFGNQRGCFNAANYIIVQHNAYEKSNNHLLCAEARIIAVKKRDDGVKAQDALEDAAAEDNDELDIQLDEDVSLQLSACCTHRC